MEKNYEFWEKVRDEFPAAKNLVYLNTAGGAPISKRAANESAKFYDQVVNFGDHWDEWQIKKEKIRKPVTKFINADMGEVAFTKNTSVGMNLFALMLKGKGEVITMHDEFPSSTFPWLNRKYKVRFVMPDKDVYTTEKISKKITNKTRILVTSHVQSSTGFKQDLNELGEFCEEKDLIFVVNATQSAGAFPIDVKKSKIDFLVASGFKWLCANYGVGLLYMNKKWTKRLHYPRIGWQSTYDSYPTDNRHLDIRPTTTALEVGCHPFSLIFSLGGAIDLLNEIGKENIEKRIYYLSDYLHEKLIENSYEITSPIEKKYRSGITIVKMDDALKTVNKLHKKNIRVSARGKGLRVSTHMYNNEQDIDTLISELNKIFKK
ncbi:MAG: aminotransferase class V-fold PLP-dependent enzyme [Candidatus Diapherotrites archaeon]